MVTYWRCGLLLLGLAGCATSAGAQADVSASVPLTETEHSGNHDERPVGQCQSDAVCGPGFVCCHSAGPGGQPLKVGYCATAEMCQTVAGEGAH